MTVADQVTRKLRRLVQTYGSEGMKKHQWDREFKRGRWDSLIDTAGDPVYAVLEKYARGGTILDLGCGSGNTANELASGGCVAYRGVDISEEAVHMAQDRTQRSGRAENTRFEQSDISAYIPGERYRVILFRDSIYYLPLASLNKVLDRYSSYLEQVGVFVVRIAGGMKSSKAIQTIVEDNFQMLEKHLTEAPPATIMVFRPLPTLPPTQLG